MRPECRLAVLIPAYNETPETILRPLRSLAGQRVPKNIFEVVCVVNNSRQEAAERSPAFLQNQTTIKFLQNLAADKELSDLQLHVLDKSSFELADEESNVGIARDRAGAEICLRFLKNGQKEKGLIVLLDADSYFSENALQAMLDIFESEGINGLSGNLELAADESLPQPEAIREIFLHVTRYGARLEKINRRRQKRLRFQKQDQLNYQALASGQNMAVTAGAWAAAGGMPHYYCLEDLRFGKKLTFLAGDLAATTDYTVYTLLRRSQRVGFISSGRIIADIVDKIQAT